MKLKVTYEESGGSCELCGPHTDLLLSILDEDTGRAVFFERNGGHFGNDSLDLTDTAAVVAAVLRALGHEVVD